MRAQNSKTFSIYYHTTSRESKWLLGTFYYIIEGIVVGNSETESPLTTAKIGIERLLKFCGHRSEPTLYALTSKEAFAKIDDALFKDDSRTDSEIERDIQYYNRFDIGGFSESLDGWKCFLIEGKIQDRILFQKHPQTKIHDVLVPAGQFNSECKNFHEEISHLEEASKVKEAAPPST